MDKYVQKRKTNRAEKEDKIKNKTWYTVLGKDPTNPNIWESLQSFQEEIYLETIHSAIHSS